MAIFLGEYTHQVDEKGRIRIPQKLKNELGPNPFIFKGIQKCIKLYPHDEAEKKLKETFSNENLDDLKSEKTKAKFMSKATIGEEDKQGRITLSPSLLKYAGIEYSSTIITVGAYDHIQIWNKEAWEKESENEYVDEKSDDNNRGID